MRGDYPGRLRAHLCDRADMLERIAAWGFLEAVNVEANNDVPVVWRIRLGLGGGSVALGQDPRGALPEKELRTAGMPVPPGHPRVSYSKALKEKTMQRIFARTLNERRRWRVARVVNRVAPWACWADLVSWVYDGHKPDRQTLRGAAQSARWCAANTAHGSCYCGKVRTPDLDEGCTGRAIRPTS